MTASLWLDICLKTADEGMARQAKEEILANTIAIPASSIDDDTATERKSRKALQILIRKLVIYVRYGCTNRKCDNQICFSNARRATDHPVRRPTILTARGIAYALADRPNPQQFFCRDPPLIDLDQLDRAIALVNSPQWSASDICTLMLDHGVPNTATKQIIFNMSATPDSAQNIQINYRDDDEFRSFTHHFERRAVPQKHCNPLVDYIRSSREPEKKDRKSLAQNIYDSQVYRDVEWKAVDGVEQPKTQTAQAALSKLSVASLMGLRAMIEYVESRTTLSGGEKTSAVASTQIDPSEIGRCQRISAFVRASLRHTLSNTEILLESFSSSIPTQSSLTSEREAMIESFSYWPDTYRLVIIQSLSSALKSLSGHISADTSKPLTTRASSFLTICLYGLLGLSRRVHAIQYGSASFRERSPGDQIEEMVGGSNAFDLEPILPLLLDLLSHFGPYKDTADHVVRVLAPSAPDTLDGTPSPQLRDQRGVLSFLGLVKAVVIENIGESPIVTDMAVMKTGLTCLQRLANSYSHHPSLIDTTGVNLAALLQMPTVMTQFTYIKMASTLLSLPEDNKIDHLLHYPFLFSENYLAICFRAISYLRLRQSFDGAKFHQELRNRIMPPLEPTWQRYLEGRMSAAANKFLVLEVNRETLLEDTLNQLWGKELRELMRPIKVLIGGEFQEMGDDHGGPTKEFFRFVFEEAFKPDVGLFIIDENSGMPWFNPVSREPAATYEALGMLVSLALHNGIHAPINFPTVFYRYITEIDTQSPALTYSLADLVDGWPILHQSFTQLLNWTEGDVSDIFTREYAFTIRDCDRVIDINLADVDRENFDWNDSVTSTGPPPGLQPELVTNDNRQAYVQDYIEFLLYTSVRPHLRAFTKGLKTTLHPSSTALLTAPLLKSITEGHPTIDFPLIRTITTYRNGFTAITPQILLFWSIVLDWPAQKQRELLEFVTANDRMPVLGVGSMQFVIEKTGEDPDHLPSSQTCFSTLKMPDYGEGVKGEKLMRGKLETVLAFGGRGFGVA